MQPIVGDHAAFSLQHVLDELRHYLPSQTPIKDFIHHNSLHAFQQDKFYEGIFKARNIFGYHVTLRLEEYRNLYQSGRISHRIIEAVIESHKGKDAVEMWMNKMLHSSRPILDIPRIGRLRSYWKSIYKFDLDNKVQPILFRMLCAYLDQGISLQSFPHHPDGFLASVRMLDADSSTSFFRTNKVRALLHDPSISTAQLLDIIVGKEAYYEQYLFDQQFSHRGWSGMVATIEAAPHTLTKTCKISLEDLVQVELLLEIDALNQRFNQQWLPLCSHEHEIEQPINVLNADGIKEEDEIYMLWQDAFEWSYYDSVLGAIQQKYQPSIVQKMPPSFQAIFCIDERECSIRRYLEMGPKVVETFGAPGFFGVEFYFKPEGAFHLEKLCPAPVTPQYLIKESKSNVKRHHAWLYHKKAHTLLGGLFFNITSGLLALGTLYNHLMHPRMTPAISDAFSHVGDDSELTIENTDPSHRENNLQIGFTIEEMTNRVEGQLRNMGLVENFAPFVYVVAHGSSSANNPHHGAHDCGACSGRPGSVNARVFAQMANHKEVRKLLQQRGIEIPELTHFVASLHDTAADRIGFFDLHQLPDNRRRTHQFNVDKFEKALDQNAKERARRFASISTSQDISKIRKAIQKRSVSMFEPRPELGHGSNALCIIGRRAVTQQIFLDRRAFLNSYDYRTDPEGTLLKNVIRPIGPVCGGINLEYYFSRIDNHKLGAGTKLPHNVMGLIGVANSSDGDLRPGLPLQMIEVHDPVRLLVVVEQSPEVVLKVIQSSSDIYDWYAKEWIHLAVINPYDSQIYIFKNNQFELYNPLCAPLESIENINTYIEQAKEMRSFTIEDATHENLPVRHLN